MKVLKFVRKITQKLLIVCRNNCFFLSYRFFFTRFVFSNARKLVILQAFSRTVMLMKKIVFIINPISGTGHKETVEDAIRTHIDATLFVPVIRYTEYAGHAAEIARKEAALGTDIVVAVGGDGTVNEVARSLVNSKTALAVVPCGSGNGLARHLRIPMDTVEAMMLINECFIQSIDYGTINGDAFFCTCGVGFDAFISMKFAEAGKRGVATYVEKTIQDGFTYKPERYKVEIDGDATVYEAFLIACANASQYGNNAYIAPNASTRDGLLDVTILTPFSTLEAPQIIVQMFNRKLESNSHVKTFKAKHVRITRESEGAAHIDGDPKMLGSIIDVEIHPASLLAVTNGHEGHRPLAFPKIQAFNREVEELQRNLRRDIQLSFFKNFVGPIQRISNLRNGVSYDKETGHEDAFASKEERDVG